MCITVKVNPQLSDLKGPGASKLDWWYFKHNKVDRNELQVRIYLHKDAGTKMTDKLNNLTEKNFLPLFLSKKMVMSRLEILVHLEKKF